jgi:TrmH family RNA methyltransferase
MTKGDIQLIRSLDDKRERTETGLFFAEGEKLVRELLASHLRARKVYLTGDATDAPEAANIAGVDFERISLKEMERASHLKTPTNCLALFEIPRYTFDAAALRGRLVLALDDVQNPGNVGTIVRLADWFGITDILCSEGTADCLNPKVVQATMGALAHVAVHYGDLAAMLSRISGTPTAGTETAAPLPVYGTFMEGENIYDAKLSQEGVIVLGSEGHGISNAIARHVTRKLFIPPYRPSTHDTLPDTSSDIPPTLSVPESLNVAIAAAIVCSEFRRRH